MVFTKRAFNPKFTNNYNAERVEKAQSIFLAEAESEVTTDLSVSIQSWLRKRGRDVQHPITERQKKELRECFELIDTDGSGSLNCSELYEVFQVMGIEVDIEQVDEFIKEMDTDGSGEIEFNEFMQIMHKQLYERDPNASVWKEDIYTEEDRKARALKKGQREEELPKKKSAPLMPLNLLAGAYRRKKVLEAVMENTQDMRKRLIASGHEFKEMHAQQQHDLELNTKGVGHAWRTKASANKVIADRMSDNPDINVDVLNPSASNTPKVTPRRDSGSTEKSSKGEPTSNLAPKSNKQGGRPDYSLFINPNLWDVIGRAMPDMIAPSPPVPEAADSDAPSKPDNPRAASSATTAAAELWGNAKETEGKQGPMAGAALVVRRDLHKRNELREKLESFQRRQPTFDANDRRVLLDKDKVVRGIMKDEMRSLARIGVVPRGAQNATENSDGTGMPKSAWAMPRAERPASVPSRFAGVREQDRSRGGAMKGMPAPRPSTVPVGIHRANHPDAIAQQISDALSYKAIPELEEPETNWLASVMATDAAESPSPKPASSRRSTSQARPSLASRAKSAPGMPRARSGMSPAEGGGGGRPGSRAAPPAAGRDLLVQRRMERDAKVRSEALHRHRSGAAQELLRSRKGVEQGWGFSRRPSSTVDTAGDFSFFGGGRPPSSGRSAYMPSEQYMPPSSREVPPGQAPTEAWVSPYTGRAAVPVEKVKGLTLDTVISSRAQAVPQPGVPIWKISEQEMLKSRRPVSVQQMRAVRSPRDGKGQRPSPRASTHHSRRC